MRKTIEIEPRTAVVLQGEWAPLQASAPTEMLRGAGVDSCEYSYVEAADGDGKPKLKKFSGVAYTGGAMLANYSLPVAIDLSGLKASGDQIPALKDHDPTQIVGHQAVEITAQRIKVSGVVSGVGQAAQEVAALSAHGYPWQMSVGVFPTKVERVEVGDRANVNGRAIDGPAYIVRAGVLREVSFVAIGADGNTSAAVAATLAAKGNGMTFLDWLKAKGFGTLTLDDAQRSFLEAAWKRETEGEQKPAGTDTGGTPTNRVDANYAAGLHELRTEIANLRASLETERGNAARDSLFAQYADRVDAGRLTAIRAEAAGSNWSADKTELMLMRASRPTSFGIHIANNDVSADVMAAAVCAHGRLPGLERTFSDQQLQAAHTQFRRGISLQEVLLRAAWRNGFSGVTTRGVERDVLRAAFSTADISGILSNVANKFLLAGYTAVESTWRQISAVRPVNDFKQVTSYRLIANAIFEEVEAEGKIAHGTLSDENMTNQAKTYAKLLSITREHIINDDLGALTAVPQQIGRGAALKVNKVFWAAFLDNATFFTSGRGNYSSGAPTALSIDALTAAELLFLNQKDPSSEPLGIMPKVLLVPNALNVKASSLSRDTEIRDTTASTKYPTGNPHAGKFTSVRSSYLSDATITGYSTAAWYLLADPQDLAVIEVAFLYGVESPTVESAEADFDTLGVQMRGIFDFGVSKQSYRAGVKMKGEA